MKYLPHTFLFSLYISYFLRAPRTFGKTPHFSLVLNMCPGPGLTRQQI